MFKNILVPTDGSELSRETARPAVSVSKEVWGPSTCAL